MRSCYMAKSEFPRFADVPAIIPALLVLLPVDVMVGLANAVVDVLGDNEVNEIRILLLVIIADEVVVKVLLASDDQGFSFHHNQPNLLHLLSSAAATLKLLLVYEGKFIFIFFMFYYQIHSPGLC